MRGAYSCTHAGHGTSSRGDKQLRCICMWGDVCAALPPPPLITAPFRLPQQAEWGPWSPLQYVGRDLKGMTIGVVGLGSIGAAVCQLLRYSA